MPVLYFGDFVHISHVFNAYWSIPLLVYLKRRLLFPGAVCLHKVLLKRKDRKYKNNRKDVRQQFIG